MTTIFCAMVAGFLVHNLINAAKAGDWMHITISVVMISGCLLMAAVNL